MVSLAALILTDPSDRQFAGVDLNERAALVAARAGISRIHLVGESLPDEDTLDRLRSRGLRVTGSHDAERPLMSAPDAGVLVVLPATTVLEPMALVSVLQHAATTPSAPALVVEREPRRKNNVLRASHGTLRSVMGDGNATSTGVAVLPAAVVERVRTVWDFGDAVHRLAKTGTLRALTTDPWFCARLRGATDIALVERLYHRHAARVEGESWVRKNIRWGSDVVTRYLQRLPRPAVSGFRFQASGIR